ncbi:MAG: flagellar basal-body rod protein FlgG [Symbiobacteriia bacterium]
MIRSLWSAASGMLAQQMNVDVISNNLANVSTPGFKKSRVEFEDLLYQTVRAPQQVGMGQDARTVAGLDVGLGVRPVATLRDFSLGSIQTTGNPTDLAIRGEGFFQVTDGTRTYYTRAGNFNVDSDGNLANPEGYRVLDTSGNPIHLDTSNLDHFEVSQDGTVTLTLTSGQRQDAGQIGLASFPNPAGLQAAGQNLNLTSAASGDAKLGAPGSGSLGMIATGSLETSNVQVVEEMVNLIVAQRAYEMSSKAVQSSDEMLGIANNLRR